MLVEVDFDKCDGNGMCVLAAPDVFELDDRDRLSVLAREPAPALWPDVEDAAQACPKLAITLRDGA